MSRIDTLSQPVPDFGSVETGIPAPLQRVARWMNELGGGVREVGPETTMTPIGPDWRLPSRDIVIAVVMAAMHAAGFPSGTSGVYSRLARIEDCVDAIGEQIGSMRLSPPLAVQITTLAPAPFILLRDIPTVIRQVDEEEFLATFFDAGLSAAGETEEDAVANLKDRMVSVFEVLDGKPADRLGPGPARQLAALRSVMQRRADAENHH